MAFGAGYHHANDDCSCVVVNVNYSNVCHASRRNYLPTNICHAPRRNYLSTPAYYVSCAAPSTTKSGRCTARTGCDSRPKESSWRGCPCICTVRHTLALDRVRCPCVCTVRSILALDRVRCPCVCMVRSILALDS